MAKPKQIRTLTMRLLRKGRTPEKAFTANFGPGGPKALQQFPWSALDGATLFIGQIFSNPPGWFSFVEGQSPGLPADLYGAGAGAVIFVPTGSRIIAVCFGQIHIALDDDAFERQFGLMVTLNSVPRAALRTFDVATPDAVTFQRRVQASKDSDLRQFGIDQRRDLARVAGGTPSDLSFARFLAGKDSLSITTGVQAATLHTKCAEVLKYFGEKAYQADYKWVDNMRKVVEKDTLNELDKIIFQEISALRKGSQSDLHMAPPEIVDYTEGSELHYNGFGSAGKTFHSLSIDDYVAELNRCKFIGDIAAIKAAHRIAAKTETGDEFSERWTVYECFVFETAISKGPKKGQYILFAGEWYRVDKTFKDEVEAFYRARLRPTALIGKTTCKNEKDLIADLDSNRKDLVKLDVTKSNPAGVIGANLEVCDFFSDKKEFIHLKDGNSSHPISHLWSQGFVSASAFMNDGKFRSTVRKHVKKKNPAFLPLLTDGTQKVPRDTYKVVFGIMRKPYVSGSPGIPFFSKLSLQATAVRIEEIGMDVQIELIEKPA